MTTDLEELLLFSLGLKGEDTGGFGLGFGLWIGAAVLQECIPMPIKKRKAI